MKSFLGGLTLAIAMALLNSTATVTPSPSACVLFRPIDSGSALESYDPSCQIACDRSVRMPSRVLK